ncbi:MAG: hypothetical protein AAFR65_11125 [Pseudomonadota bacterium]
MRKSLSYWDLVDLLREIEDPDVRQIASNVFAQKLAPKSGFNAEMFCEKSGAKLMGPTTLRALRKEAP